MNNPYIKDWKYFPTLFTGNYFKISGELSYRPLVTLSYFIDYTLWHHNPFGFHLANLLLHALNVFLVYSLISEITKDLELAGISSLFFGVHPILTETVNSVGFREDLLCATFFLLTLFFYVKIYTSKYKNTCYAAILSHCSQRRLSYHTRNIHHETSFFLLRSFVDLHRIHHLTALQQTKGNNLFYSMDIHYADTRYEYYTHWQ
ncbi:MAG: hypothetical protein E3K36_05520 [Candidatus Brocadia sp.]|nr:hypothetical protein [Candidatus Brocadia sp.]